MTIQKPPAKVIIVVDDDGIVLRGYKREFELLLRKLIISDVAVFKYESGQKALVALQGGLDAERGPLGYRFEYFIVSDGNMPGMNGDEFINRARHLLDKRIKRAFLITGNPEEFRAGAESIDYTLLGKPVEMTSLINDLRSFLLPSDAPP